MTSLAKIFSTGVVCSVTGWLPADLRALRNRNGLFPETRQGGVGYTWTKYSFVDLCVADVVARMMRLGFSGSEAVSIASALDDIFYYLCKDSETTDRWAMVRRGIAQIAGGIAIKRLGSSFSSSDLTMDNGDPGAGVLIDCLEIVAHVRAVVDAARESAR